MPVLPCAHIAYVHRPGIVKVRLLLEACLSITVTTQTVCKCRDGLVGIHAYLHKVRQPSCLLTMTPNGWADQVAVCLVRCFVAIPDSGCATQLTSQLLAVSCSALYRSSLKNRQQNSFSTSSLCTPMSEQQDRLRQQSTLHSHVSCSWLSLPASLHPDGQSSG